jgi:hypothetical protein
MFSLTVSAGIEVKCWCTIPMPARRAALGDAKPGVVIDMPARSLTVIVPASGRRSPYAACISVDLPAPFSPNSACT